MEEDSKTTCEAAYPPILDACCGGRMMYFDKHDKRVLGQDIRVVPRYKIESNGSWFEVAPDVVGDFRKMEFPDNTFSLVVFDPPHLNCGKTSFMFYKYGTLDTKTRDSDLRSGFAECFRVLKPGGTLVFKWSDAFRSLKQVLELTPYKPVFSHTARSKGKENKTFFVVFFKESDTPRRNCDRFNTGDVKQDAQDAMMAILDEGVAGYRGIAEYLLSPTRTKQEGGNNEDN